MRVSTQRVRASEQVQAGALSRSVDGYNDVRREIQRLKTHLASVKGSKVSTPIHTAAVPSLVPPLI